MISKTKEKKAAALAATPAISVVSNVDLLDLFQEHDDLTKDISEAVEDRQKVLRDLKEKFGPGPFVLGNGNKVIVDNSGQKLFLKNI
jgi:hypothetical protein